MKCDGQTSDRDTPLFLADLSKERRCVRHDLQIYQNKGVKLRWIARVAEAARVVRMRRGGLWKEWPRHGRRAPRKLRVDDN